LPPELSRFTCKRRESGEGGIRTHETALHRLRDFQSRSFGQLGHLSGGDGQESTKKRTCCYFISAALGRVAGVHTALFTALVLEGAFVTHGRQLPDDPRRGVSIEVRALRHHLGRLICQEVGDHARVLEPDRTGGCARL
jgi:hypothetical protein